MPTPKLFYMKKFLQLLNDHAFVTMLDLGSGDGRYAKIAREKGIKVTTLDLKPSDGEDHIQTDLENWLPMEQYDFILMRNVIQFLPREYVLNTLLPSVREHGKIVYIRTFTPEEKEIGMSRYTEEDFPGAVVSRWEEDGVKLNGTPHHFYLITAVYKRW